MRSEAGEADVQVAGLSFQLRTGTADAHKTAERAAFVRGFLRGIVDVKAYRSLLERLYPVYREMEALIRRGRTHPAVGPLNRPELFRTDALAADIEFFGGDVRSVLPLSAATRRYVQRLREVGAQAPALLASHAYTRYLGDLSGGRVLAKMLRKSLRLVPGEGDAFYAFDRIDDVAVYKADYKRMLDRLPLGEITQSVMVDEAQLAFGFNRQIFDELDGSAFRALVQTMAPSLSRWIYRFSAARSTLR
ncbi:MAG: biliverdin-producing heme oxygenase [Myxococcota bacterium]